MGGRWLVANMGVSPLTGRRYWVAVSPFIDAEVGHILRPWSTWREAFDYADRMARGWE